VYSTRLHVYTRASLSDNLARILVRKSARVGRVGGQVGEDVHVGVGVGPIEFNLYRPSPFSFSKSSLNGIQL